MTGAVSLLARAPYPVLDHFLAGRDNNLNAIRMIAASAVLVSHAFPIALGEGAPEPLQAATGMALGGHAVMVFFVLSGLLIARSYDRNPDVVRYLAARAARLFPALAVVVALTPVAGAFFTTLPLREYVVDPATWTYFPRNLSLAFLQYPLPGVFEYNPLPRTINGSLWTLFYEVVCYGAVLLTGLAGLLRKRAILTVGVAILAIAFVLAQGWQPQGGLAYRAERLLQLGFPFAMGMLAYVWRDKLVLDLRLVIALWVLPLVAAGSQLMLLTIVLAVAYTVIFIGFYPKGWALAYNRLGDYSYGAYIYAFPVQQMMAHLFPDSSPFVNIALAAPCTLALAVLSWHMIESRALAMVGRAPHMRQRPIPAPPAPLDTGRP